MRLPSGSMPGRTRARLLQHLEPKLRRPDRRDLAAGSGPDDNDVKFHSVCVIAFATSYAFRPRARALKVRVLTRSSRSITSLRLSRRMP